MTKWMIWISLGLLSACSDEAAPSDSETLVFTGGPADSAEDFRVRADGITVWVEPTAVQHATIERWVISGRTSYSIARISATVAGNEAEAKATSARKFEVLLSADELVPNLADEPALITIETTSGKTFTVNVGLTARFRNASGSSKLYPWQNIEPVVMARENVFRGRVTTRGEFDYVQGSNDDDSEPTPWQEDKTHWVLDFPTYALPWAASPTEDALYINGQYNGQRYEKSAEIHMEISRLGVTNGDPATVWPAPSCEASVQTCIDQIGASGDLEPCGRAREVRACDIAADPEVAVLPWKKRFADDLRAAIIQYYVVHGEDIVASGGNTQPQALLAVDTNKITEITDPEEDPEAHDLSRVRVFSHPDMTFPGSDIVWFGAYDTQTGALIGSIYEFN